MTRVCRAAMLPLCLFVVAACGGSEKASTASKPTIRDSAGVTIVENDTPAWTDADAWTITDSPSVDIGKVQGDTNYQLFQVTGAVRLSDGTIVVANSGTTQLRFYDASGHFLRSAGREGSGPGEFKALAGVYRLPSDSVAAFDYSQRRISVFTSAGSFVRGFLLQGPGNSSFPTPEGVFGDGSFLVRNLTFFTPGMKSGAHRDSATYFRTDTSGTLADTLGTFLGDERLVVASENMVGVSTLAFGRGAFSAARDSTFYFGNNDTYAFEILGENGRLRRIVRRPHEPAPVTDAAIAAFKRAQLAFAQTDNQRRFEERMLAKMPYPKTMPAYKDLEVDRLGNVWIQAFTAPDDSSNVWTVFNRDGWMLGAVTLPRGFQVRDVGADYVLGLWKDENDVEHVMEYGLRKPEAQGKEGA